MLFPEKDPRILKWPLMQNITTVNLIVLSYLVFVKILGPIYMKNREPYSLRKIILLYNFVMVVYSGWMVYKLGKHGWFGKYSWLCEPLNFSEDEDAMGMVQVCWHFFFSKIIELLDTVFFILRKKSTQVTFLHVCHHAVVPIAVHYLISHGASGFNTLSFLINTFIHTWMYLYYALSALGPSMQKYLWWKKYLTALQMIQFCFITVVLLLYTIHPDCEVNPVLISIHVGVALLFLALFADFYRSKYQSTYTRVRASNYPLLEKGK